MTDYKRLKEDITGLTACYRILKNNDISTGEQACLLDTKYILLKDLILEGSVLGGQIFEVLYHCPSWDFEIKLNFYNGLLDIAERGRLEL